MALEMQKQPGGAWEAVEASGGGGSLTLPVNLGPDLFTIGDDGATLIDTAGETNAFTLTASTDFNGDGLGLYVSAVSGDTVVSVDADIINLADSTFTNLIKIDSSGLGFFDHGTTTQPVVPLTTPNVQDVIDALVALGLVAQHD